MRKVSSGVRLQGIECGDCRGTGRLSLIGSARNIPAWFTNRAIATLVGLGVVDAKPKMRACDEAPL